MMNFTLEELANFAQNERQWVDDMLNKNEMVHAKEALEPRKESVNRIIAYSKALSLRKSKRLNEFLLLLN